MIFTIYSEPVMPELTVFEYKFKYTFSNLLN